MKKIFGWIKKVYIMVITFCISMYTKVLALEPQALYGVPENVDTESFRKYSVIFGIVRNFIILIVFTIGSIVYFKKSSQKNSRKIITIVVALVVILLICFGINYLWINSI